VLQYLRQQQVRFELHRLRLEEDSRVVGTYLHLYQQKRLNEDCKEELSAQQLKAAYSELFVRSDNPTFASMATFVRIMKTLIMGFQSCQFSPEVIKSMIGDLKDINITLDIGSRGVEYLTQIYQGLRNDLFDGLLQTAKEMTPRCVAVIRSEQQEAVKGERTESRSDVITGWENSNHFCVFFLKDSSISSVYRNFEKVPDNFARVMYLQGSYTQYAHKQLETILSKGYRMEDYSSKTHKELLNILIKVYTPPSSPVPPDSLNLVYVITPDNYFKMRLIALRADCKLPVRLRRSNLRTIVLGLATC